MSLFNAIGAALGIKTKKNNLTGNAGLSSIIGMGGAAGAIGGAIGGGSSKPVATDHTHDSDSKNEARTNALAAKNNSGSTNVGSLSSFMGKNQMDNFQSLTDPLAVDRAGRAKSSQELDPVGIKPAMNPPFATPIDIDQQGINSLYSNEF